MKDPLQRDRSAVLGTFTRFPMAPVRGRGARVWDAQGRAYLDFACGISVTNLGHGHPALIRAIAAQAGRLCHAGNLFVQGPQVDLAEALLEAAPFARKVAFANSGAEANELLIKLARRHGAPRGRGEILAFHGSFHGRTYGALSASGQVKLHRGMEPLLPGFRHAPFNDLAAVERAVGPRTAAILVEPVQGENGVVPAEDAFLEGLRRLADRHGLLLLLDEIQTGLGRTGPLFAHQRLGRRCLPDAMSLAKSLGGGLPLSAVLFGPRASGVLGLGEHGTTMGGNPVACAAGLAQLRLLRAPALQRGARRAAEVLAAGLEGLKARHPALVLEVRGRGLMLGLKLAVESRPVVLECLRRGLVANATAGDVVRLLPPLTLTETEARRGLDILDAVLGRTRPPRGSASDPKKGKRA